MSFFIRISAVCLFAHVAVGSALGDYVQSHSRVPRPLREFRGAWVATVHNIDWPSRPGLSGRQQRDELIQLLDLAAQIGLNAIILQVRTECDALYASRIEPWSYWLSGKMGSPPSDRYDPLAFAILEAHRRGIELHAWFNPFRSSATATSEKSRTHISRTHPSLMMRAGTQVWADPGSDYVTDRAIQVMVDVTRRYDIDAVHMDDYFYPYPKTSGDKVYDQFDDSASYGKYRSKGGRLGVRDWRRSRIDGFVSQLYRSVKSTKPWVKFGISPFGIWRPHNPPSIEAGLDAYDHIFADSRKWLRNGWIDYFSPQLYWRIDDTPHSFTTLTKWWASQNKKKRHLWPGIASNRIRSSDDPRRKASETTREIDVTRRYGSNKEGAGNIQWSIGAIRNDRDGLRAQLAASFREVAIPPASPWLGSKAPSPTYVAVAEEGGALHLSFKMAGDVRWRVIQIRPSRKDSWVTLRMIPGGQETYRFERAPSEIAIRSMGPTGMLSKPTVLKRR